MSKQFKFFSWAQVVPKNQKLKVTRDSIDSDEKFLDKNLPNSSKMVSLKKYSKEKKLNNFCEGIQETRLKYLKEFCEKNKM